MSGLLYVVECSEPTPSDPQAATEAAREKCREFFPHIADTNLQVGRGTYKGYACWTMSYQSSSGAITKTVVREDEQTWLDLPKVGDTSRAIGYWTDKPPIPADLERPDPWNSKVMRIGVLDGPDVDTWWSLPIIPTDIPKAYSCLEDKWQHDRQMLADLMPLCKKYYDLDNLGWSLIEESESIEEKMKRPDLDPGVRADWQKRLKEIDEQAQTLRVADKERAYDCLKVLGLTHYITEFEADLLRLLTPQTMLTILMKCTQDKGAIEAQLEAEKKSE